MSVWDRALGNAANVAQVTGINAVGVIATIGRAVRTAHRNPKDDLKRNVDMLEDVRTRLQEQEYNPLATRLLPRLEETLKEARALMSKGRMQRFINGSQMAERFRDVETKINIIYLSSFPLLRHTAIARAEEFTRAEVVEATDGFTVVLSASDSATVYRGTLHDGREVAVKRLNNTGAGPPQDAFFTEVAILSLIRHRHIARLVGSCAYGDERIVVTHPCTGNGSLYDHLHGHRASSSSPVTASWEARVRVLLGAARAVEHLHCHAPLIINANVTSSAILLEGATCEPLLSDFGRAVWLEAGVESQAVDLAAAAEGYADPEHCSTGDAGGALKPASDVYSLGVVMLEVLTGKPPVDLVSFALPSIQHQQAGGGRLLDVLDRLPASDPTAQLEPLQILADTAARCLRQCGDDRPPIRDVVADLEKAHSLICTGNELGGDGPRRSVK